MLKLKQQYSRLFVAVMPGEFPRRYPAISFPPVEGRIALRVWRALGIRFRGASELFELFEVQIKSSLVSR